jgi:hypothetical protein
MRSLEEGEWPLSIEFFGRCCDDRELQSSVLRHRVANIFDWAEVELIVGPRTNEMTTAFEREYFDEVVRFDFPNKSVLKGERMFRENVRRHVLKMARRRAAARRAKGKR